MNSWIKPLVATSALAMLAFATTADARPGARGASDSPKSRPTFRGQRMPARSALIKRVPQRTRRSLEGLRARRGARGDAREQPPLSHAVYPAKATSDSGKLRVTHFTSLLWQTPGLYLAESPSGGVDLAVSGVGGKHVMLKCQVGPQRKDMVLTLSRDSGPKLQKTLPKVGHQFVTFAIPNAPESFEFSLGAADVEDGPTNGVSWLFYGCNMELK